MKTRHRLSLALLLLGLSPALYSQNPNDTGPSATGQYSSANCGDPLLNPDETCQADQGQYGGQIQELGQPYGEQSQGMGQPYGEQGQGMGQPYGQQPGQYGQQTIPWPNQTQMLPNLNSPLGPFPSSINGTQIENAPLNPLTWQRQQQIQLRSEMPSDFQKFVAATTGQMLPIYGASLFQNAPTTFSPNNLAPVTSDYVIGPDDQLRIRIWGPFNYSGNLRVDRSGNIFLPQVGAVHVAGLQFASLDQHLRKAVSRIYRNFDLSVDVGQIRAMQIYVAGEARRPGAYTVSSLSSLVDALFATGGPSAQGSLRHVLVKRNGATIADFDLYALLIDGDKSTDIRLLPEDVLYIPPVGPQVAIAGTVRNQAVYELRGHETIGDLIALAGKTSAMSSNTRISLERVELHQVRRAMEIPFTAQGLKFPLEDGDIVRIYPILPAYEKTVTLRGNVANPGRFAWTEGMHLSDLVPDRDSLQSRDYWWKRSRLGLPVPSYQSTAQRINSPRAAAAGLHGSLATQVDELQNDRDEDNLSNDNRTGNNNQIRNYRRNTVTLSTPEINWDYAVIERTDPDTLKTSLIPFDLGKLVLDHDTSQNLALQPGDVVTIFSQSDIQVPITQQTKYVDLEGEFLHAGVYSVQPNETLRDLVKRAGGLTPKAYLYGSEFSRRSTRVLQQQRLDEYVQTVRMEAERGTQALAISGSSTGSSAGDVAASQAATQDLIARLSQIRATGRIVLQFRPDSTGIDTIPALSLENGDKFVVPPAPSTVNVVGAVYDQNSFLYRRGQSVSHYLELAGGPNRNADRHHAFVIRADGSVMSRSSEKSMTLWTNAFDKLRLYPGDTIVVPEKTMRPTALRGVMDWTQTFSQLALGAAAIHTF